MGQLSHPARERRGVHPGMRRQTSGATDSPVDLTVLWKEVQSAIHCLKGRKSPGFNNVPAKLLKHEEETEHLPLSENLGR